MSNYCINNVTISGDKHLLDLLETNKFSFNSIIPMPESAKENWKLWRISSWGTKWDIDKDDIVIDRRSNNILELSFATAWSPPVEIFEELCDKGLDVQAFYYEGSDNFGGVFRGGEDLRFNIDEDFLINNSIGQELEQQYGIIDFLSQQ